MRTILGEGPTPAAIMLIGERPGWEETRENRPFVGPAGRELWDTLKRIGVYRDDVYVTNVVKTFSKEPPTPDEIEKWTPTLLNELATVRPTTIVTVGAHALRWFMGPDAEIDKMHGLVFQPPMRSAKTKLLPMYHSSAALRQPELYQADFRNDVRALGEWLKGTRQVHTTTKADVAAHDLRGVPPPAHTRMLEVVADEILGLDFEGTIERPECLTIADRYASWLIGAEQQGLAIRLVEKARRFCMHYAVRDLRAAWTLGLNVVAFDDSMLGAYLLDEPQALKTLAFRELGLEMDSYADLITPIDEARCRTTLAAARDVAAHEQSDRDAARAALLADARASKNKTKIYLAKRKIRREKKQTARDKRCLTSLIRITDENRSAEKSIRARWSDSAFSDKVGLPPEPTWQDIPSAIGVPYACVDAYAHVQVWQKLKPRLKREGLWPCYKMDRAVIPMLARIEHVGMAVDGAALEKLSRDLHLDYVKVCGELEALLGYLLNPKASEDVADALFDDLGVTPTKLTKSGKHQTTGDKYLEARKKEHAAIPLIIKGRELWKLKSSYCDKLPAMLVDGRYHPEFGYTRTASGRLAETIILLIPKHSLVGKKIRAAFVAGDGHSIVSCDLGQIELRVLAHLSGDKALLQVFRDGRDPHTETAHRLLGAPKQKEDQDESQHRLPSKKCNFGAFMGLSELGLTDQIRAGGNPDWAKGCPHCDFTGADIRDRGDHASDCASRLFFREYFKLYPGIRSYIDDRHAEARRYGFVRDMWGRKIYVAGIYSSSRGVVGRFERMAQATPVQAGADGISKHWNAAIWEWIVSTRSATRYLEPYTRTHDDTVLETDEKFAKRTRDRMLELVPQVLRIPVTADGKIGPNWGELHK